MVKETVLGTLLLLCVQSSVADTAPSDSLPGRKDPLYLQIFAGINKSANENLPFSEFSKYPWSFGAFAAAGKEFSPLWGWRAAVRFNNNKSRNVQKCESPDTYQWNNVALFGDLTFDITDAVRKKNRKAGRFNLKAFAGVGMAYTFGFDKVPLSYTHPYSRKSKLLPGARAGLTATYQVASRWRIGAELSHNIFADKFNGVKADAPIDMRTNLKIGVVLLLHKKPKPEKIVDRRKRLKTCPPLPFLLPKPEDVKTRYIAGRAFLDFPVNEMVIYNDYRNNKAELQRIKASIDSAMFDKSVIVKQISLHGYASPESPYSNNVRLSKGRVATLRDLLKRKYNLNSTTFILENTPEDWANLRGFIAGVNHRRAKGDYWYDTPSYMETPQVPEMVTRHRDEMLRLIDSEMDPDIKEEQLKQIGGGEPYRWLLKNVYPGLRHTDYIIEYEVRQYPVKEGRKLIYTHPEALSLDEMYRIAQSYGEGSDGWFDVLIIAAKTYPKSDTANYNAACACAMTNRFRNAHLYLDKVSETENTLYLRDVLMAMEGTVDWEMVNGKVIVK